MVPLDDLLALGNQHYRAGRFENARRAYSQYLQAAPESPFVWYLLAAVEDAQGHFAEAEKHLRESLRLQADYAPSFYQLGVTLAHQGRHQEAAESFRALLRIKPGYGSAYRHLGASLSAQGKFDEAEEAFRAGLRFNPAAAQGYIELASTLIRQMNVDAAIAIFTEAARLAPTSAEVQTAWGMALIDLGRSEEAITHVHEALRLKPDDALGYGLLGELMRDGAYGFTDAELAAVQGLLADTKTAQADRITLHFTMAYVLDAQGRCDEAFEHYRQGNDLKHEMNRARGIAFDIAVHRGVVNDFIGTFPGKLFPRIAALGHPSDKPVFIVGVPRSGTTLVNQILAAHPQVSGPGELGDIGHIMADLPRLLNWPGAHDLMQHLDGATAHALAERYLRRIDRLGGAAVRVLDKTPENYIFLGLIAVLFPKARVIHCRRNPVATCVSCYMQNFQHLRFTTSLESLGLYYLEYERLMAHWRAVLPMRMFEVEYEALVARPEAVSRELVAHCGLAWDDRCLAFNTQKGAVHTASRTQIRQPIYTRSVERWKRYEKHLGPLLRALAST
jgi:tetratricopeptide (TPR) repeat protein